MNKNLTAREKEILALVRVGQRSKEISEKFGTKEQTVRNQLGVIYLKLGVRNRTEAAIWEGKWSRNAKRQH